MCQLWSSWQCIVNCPRPANQMLVFGQNKWEWHQPKWIVAQTQSEQNGCCRKTRSTLSRFLTSLSTCQMQFRFQHLEWCPLQHFVRWAAHWTDQPSRIPKTGIRSGSNFTRPSTLPYLAALDANHPVLPKNKIMAKMHWFQTLMTMVINTPTCRRAAIPGNDNWHALVRKNQNSAFLESKVSK